ncbi:hypothetical protein HZB90_04775 [archaeon]|nr:hypothetical protein [archaeon]
MADPPKIIKEALADGRIQTRIREEDSSFLTRFFIIQSRKSLRVAKTLYAIDQDEVAKGRYSYAKTDSGHLWVINASYYSMFYLVRALLAHRRIKLGNMRGVHDLTQKCFEHFLIDAGFVGRMFKEMYAETKEAASGLLQLEDYPARLKKEYDRAIASRVKFTYQTTVSFEGKEAKEVLSIADRFFNELSAIMTKSPNLL